MFRSTKIFSILIHLFLLLGLLEIPVQQYKNQNAQHVIIQGEQSEERLRRRQMNENGTAVTTLKVLGKT
jgi:hypothetical protein